MNPLADLKRLAKRLHDERDAARPIIERLREHPDGELPAASITAGLVHELLCAASDLLERSPATSEALAQRAVAAAATLDDSYPRVLRAQLAGSAWKEVANARRYRSDCEGALRALDLADASIAEEGSLGHDQAVMALARATTLRDLNRSPEALRYLASATAIFDEHGDDRRVAQCELLAGMIHHGQGDAAAAEDAYREAIATAQFIGDAQTVASAYTNLGVLAAEQGRTNAALDALQQARAIFEELRAHGEVARANWGVGLALLTAGRFEAAIQVLRDARSVFLTIGMAEEAGLAGVELAEAYLARGRHRAAHRVILAVIEEFRAANLNERALTALAYLRDLGPAARRESARHVYTYLSRLRREPQLLFLPADES